VQEPPAQRFETNHEPSGDPRAPAAQAAAQPWTSDSDAIARWAAAPAFPSAPEARSAPVERPAAASGPPAEAGRPAAAGTSDSVDDWYTKPPQQQPPAPHPPPAADAPAPQAWPAQPAHDAPAHNTPAHNTPAHNAPAQYPAAHNTGPQPAPRQTAEPDTTQAWSVEATPASGSSWPGANDHTPNEPNAAESIVPDSWFAAPRPAEPEATERWTPQPADADPWAADQQAHGATQAWGPEHHGGQAWGQEPHGGQGWGAEARGGQAWGQEPHAGQGWGAEQPYGGPGYPPRNETAMLGADFPPGHGYPPVEQRHGRAGKPLIFVVTGLVIAAMVAVAFVMWPKGGGDTPGSPTPAAVNSPASSAAARPQATAINSLLNASAASRGELGRALAAAKTCKGLPAAIAGMQRVAEQRQQQATRAQALKVDALPNGARLRGHLARAFQLSLQVDQAYLTWAQGAQGCKGRPKPDAEYRRGGQLSNQASVSKQRFAALWAPVAKKQHLPARTANQF
jgi:hypothetical protein